MTFDEALDKSRVLSMDGTKQIYSDDVIKLINELRQEYAPTVEMTDAQYKILVRARNNAVNRVDKVGLLEFMSACSLLNLEIDHLSLMQAWLHPETIKVVEE